MNKKLILALVSFIVLLGLAAYMLFSASSSSYMQIVGFLIAVCAGGLLEGQMHISELLEKDIKIKK